jgi:hypothetical protein
MESLGLSRRDPRVVEAVDTWPACMQAAGHPYVVDIWYAAASEVVERVLVGTTNSLE